MYVAFKDPCRADRQRIDRLVEAIGSRKLKDIKHATLVEAARLLYPDAKPSSLNRSVIAPAAAILHYAAENGLCSYQRIRRFKESPPPTRAVSREIAEALIAKAEGDAKTLLIWLFNQGTRISDALRVQWEDIDLRDRTVRMKVSKADEWRVFPLADAVFFRLANAPKKSGPLFPYPNRWAAYRALKPVVDAAKVKFTPHMARHSLGTWLNERGAGLKTIMSALGHRDAKSSMRYQHADVEVVRAAISSAVVGNKR